jgi:hypothetical protein
MIHYILLPAQERKALRWEYRLRLAIVTFLFISLALVFGIASLLPSYIYTYNQENEATLHLEALNKSRKASGADQDDKNLIINQSFALKMVAEEDKLDDVSVIEKIVALKPKNLIINSFENDHAVSTTTVGSVTVQGYAPTREGLLDFKKAFENDKTFANPELPISDLAKSKEINFSLKVSIRK